MGGHQAGDFASKCTVEVLIKGTRGSQEEDIEKALVLVGASKQPIREIIKRLRRRTS